MQARSVVIVGATILFALGCGGALIPDDGELSACSAYIDSGSMPVWSVEQVLNGNIDALNDETVECYMGVFHEDSGQILATYALTQQLYEQYDLVASFDGPLQVDTLPNGDAEVSFSQITKNSNSEPFNANRSTGVHLMRKNDAGRWRLVSTVIQQTTPLP
jgi:hypothetical protein